MFQRMCSMKENYVIILAYSQPHKKLHDKWGRRRLWGLSHENLMHGASVSMYSKSLQEKSRLLLVYLTGKLGIAIVIIMITQHTFTLLQQVDIVSDTCSQLIPLALKVESKGLLLRALFRSCWSQLVDPEFEHLQQNTVLASSLHCT